MVYKGKIACPKVVMRKKIILILVSSVFILALSAFFWKDVLVASPLFFGYRGDDLFGVYTANLDGSNFHTVLLDSRREITHARVSPDRKHMTFTRYNRVVKDGLCEENGSGYRNTEVVIANIDGTQQFDVEPTGAEILNANSSWIDNENIIYIHCENLKSLPELRSFNLPSKKITRIRLSDRPQFAMSDPHCIGKTVISPVIPLDEKGTCALWTFSSDGTGLRQITKPVITPTSTKRDFKLGDYDPWLSPTADTVAFMRYFGGMDWRIYTANMSDGVEHEITKAGIPNGIPKWSSDGKLIAFVSWDNSKLENLGLYTMTPTGSNRKKIPLPAGYLYTHPSFFPDSGSAGNAMLMFSGRRVPGLPK